MLRKTWIRCLLIAAPIVCILSCFFLKDTAFYIAKNHLPECESFSNFGIYCPGCGLTRCILALMSGDILLAVRSNAVIICLFAFILILYSEVFLISFFGRDVKILPRNKWFWIAFAVCSTVYFVLRNFIPFLEPPITI